MKLKPGRVIKISVDKYGYPDDKKMREQSKSRARAFGQKVAAEINEKVFQQVLSWKKKGSEMDVIYQPRGRAREYSDWALNIATGCVHGCKYCYAPNCLRKSAEEYHLKAAIKKDIIKRTEKDLAKIQTGMDKRILLSFVTDPYQNEEVASVTRTILELFVKYGIAFQVLTKGAKRSPKDFDLYRPCDAYATTLTFADPIKSKEIEPGAALPEERISAIREAKGRGLATWVSFEPALDEESVFELFDETKSYVDLYKIGKVSNYPSNVKDWKGFALKMIRLCEENKKEYYIKNDLKKYLAG